MKSVNYRAETARERQRCDRSRDPSRAHIIEHSLLCCRGLGQRLDIIVQFEQLFFALFCFTRSIMTSFELRKDLGFEILSAL